MTRTERAAYPRALNRDRSESRTGLDPSLRKGGAGSHNWGSIADERHLEANALDDESMERPADLATGLEPSRTSPKPPMQRNDSDSSSTSNHITDEELDKARKLRKHAFKNSDRPLDLSAIARTSPAVSGPPRAVNITRRTELPV